MILGGDRLSDQAGDRARADTGGLQGRYCARCRVSGCGLWQSHEAAPGAQGPGTTSCRRHSVEHDAVGIRHGAAASEAMVGSRSAADAPVPQRQAPPCLGQGDRARLSQACLADDRLARRHRRATVLAFRSPARACRSSRQAARGGMAVDRNDRSSREATIEMPVLRPKNRARQPLLF